MNFQICSQNEWLYPDSKVTSPFEGKPLTMSSAKNAHTGFQLLFNHLDRGILTITTRDMPSDITLECNKLIDVLVEKNTGPVSMCAGEGEDATPYTTRKAPFRVYDAVLPCGEETNAITHDTQAYYLSFKTSHAATAGEYSFDLLILYNGNEQVIPVRFRVYDVAVPEEGRLFISNWFGLAQMAAQHHVAMWSEEHWEMIEKYSKLMRRTRQTHFLIPREIISASVSTDGRYTFDFTHTKRLIELFLSLGFTYIEGNLLAYRADFWDSTFLVDAAGETVPALSDQGYDYMSQYMIAWREFLIDNNWLSILYQHVADEPIPACAQEYRILSGIVRKFLPGVPLMEAVEMADLDGAVDIWIPKNSWYTEHREAFERKRRNGDKLWFYTCCFPGGFYLNRLWDMPLIRTRLLHTGNYRYDMEGYLHWGFNFCDADKDPYNQKDIFFPPGDTHLSYPHGDKPIGSMRLEMMRCGVEDYELLSLLAETHKPLADSIAEEWLPAFDCANEDITAFSKNRERLLQALENRKKLFTQTLSPLVKVFPDEKPLSERHDSVTALMGERVSYQVVYGSDDHVGRVYVEVHSEISAYVKLFSVGLVPCELPQYKDHDDYLLRTKPGLFPDVLSSFTYIDVLPEQYGSCWVYVDTAGITPGRYEIVLSFLHGDQREMLAQEWFTVEVLPAELPSQRFIHTEWFYMDCLATTYGVDVFSDEHKRIVENYVTHYAHRGMNMILTPVFTPPLEMNIGGDRPTVQLVDVTKNRDHYDFDFTRLEWFITMCREKGIRHFEISHLFTQWGAAYAPKVIAWVDGEQQQIFGWETEADSPEYTGFVKQFLTALDGFIKTHALTDAVFLHVSDEPNLYCIDTYQKASDTVRGEALPYPILDALSDYEIYRKGFVDRPVASTEHIHLFLEKEVPHLWAYYCCCEYRDGLSNRFINMPGERTRILGFQLYAAGVEGFLHWGYNHWYSGRSSIQDLDPYRVTDAAHSFPSGDAFLVYPGKDGKPVDSIRMLLIEQAMQDIRAAQLLENLAGRETVLSIINRNQNLTFKQYAHSPASLLSIREEINKAIRDYVRNGKIIT